MSEVIGLIVTAYLVAAAAYIINRVVVLAIDGDVRDKLFGIELPFPVPRSLYLAAAVIGLVISGLTWPRGVVRSFRREKKP